MSVKISGVISDSDDKKINECINKGQFISRSDAVREGIKSLIRSKLPKSGTE